MKKINIVVNILCILIMGISAYLPFHDPSPVHALTTNLTISGYGTLTGATYVGGTTDWDNLNSDDGNTEYVQGACTTGFCSYTYTHTAFSTAHLEINSVTIYYKADTVTAGLCNIGWYIGGSVYAAGTSSDDYILTSKTWATNPATGLPWTAAQLNSAQVWIQPYDSWAFPAGNRYSYIYVVVDYDAPVAPTVTTQAATSIAPTTCTGNGNITSNGGDTITEKGICYKAGSSGDPTTADSTSHDHVDSTGAYTEAIVGLTKGTAYRLRAYAINSAGTGYGTTVGITTIGDPTISTLIASMVVSTTARLNANVTFDGNVDGGEDCTVTFVYVADGAGHPYANYAAILADGGTETAATGTYHTGELPYLDISSLTVSTDYSFAVKIVNSTATTAYGSVLTFTTESGVYTPTNFTAISTATTVSLAWTKGVGAQYTLVRYSPASYPATTGDGTVAYLGTGNSHLLTGLTPGTTYYFAAWGKTGTTYSASSITTLSTTLAYDTGSSSGSIEAPPANSMWTQTPDTTKVANIPILADLIELNQAAYKTPLNMMWYLVWVLLSVGVSAYIYNKGGQKLPLGLGASALMFSLGAVLGLTMLWVMVGFSIIGAGISIWGDRR